MSFRTLPIKSGGGGTAPIRPFQISDDSTRGPDGNITSAKVKLASSLLAGAVPTGLTGLSVANGYKIYAHLTYNTVAPGNFTARAIGSAATIPTNSVGNKYIQIGSVSINGSRLIITNDIFGPIEACRVLFASPIEYNLYGTG